MPAQMNEAAIVVPARTGNSLFRRSGHSLIRVCDRPGAWGEAGPNYRNRRNWFSGRLYFLKMGLERLMLHLSVRFPLTSIVCFVWVQTLILSLMVNGV